MRRLQYFTVTLFSMFFLVSCEITIKEIGAKEEEKKNSVTPDLYAVLYQQTAAEYVALCYQAYNIAELRLNEILKQTHDKPMAIVVDIDETVLNNVRYQADAILNGYTFSDETWDQWVAQMEADPVPGAVKFLNYAAEKGVETFYITNREENDRVSHRASTLTNLKNVGFPFAEDKNLLLMNTSSEKDTRRNQVLENYDIVMLIGDNLGDFSGIFDSKNATVRMDATNEFESYFGERWIVLPNAMYGKWVSALPKCDSTVGQINCLKKNLIGFSNNE